MYLIILIIPILSPFSSGEYYTSLNESLYSEVYKLLALLILYFTLTTSLVLIYFNTLLS